MSAFKLPDGRILIPVRAEGEGMIGDGLKPISPDSEEAKEWAYDTKPATEFLIKRWKDRHL